MNKIAFALLWCFVFVAPWEEVVHIPGLGSVPRLVGMLAWIFGVLHVLARGSMRRLSPFQLCAALFVLWAAVSGFWTIDPEATTARVLTYLQLAAMAWLISNFASTPKSLRALLAAYVLGTCVAAIATIQSYFSGVSLDAQATRFAGLDANPNDLGLTVALGLPMAWYLSIAQPRRRIEWTWQLCLPLGITAILLTASRGATVAGIVALLIIPLTLQRLRFRMRIALCVLAVGSAVLASNLVPKPSLERIGTTRSDVAAWNFGGRTAIWQAGLEVMRSHPLVGVGAGAFGSAVEPTLGAQRSSHQTFLSVLVEQGVVGLALFLAMIAAVTAPVAPLPPLERRFSIVLLAVLAIGSLSSALDYRKSVWFVLAVLAVHAGVRPVSRTVQRARPALAGEPTRNDQC